MKSSNSLHTTTPLTVQDAASGSGKAVFLVMYSDDEWAFGNNVLNSPDAAACLRCSVIAVKPLRIVAIFLSHYYPFNL